MSKKSFWTIAIFYLFIAFEFFYMASPVAAYFYSIYGPGLIFINNNPALEWLCSMFLPHIVIDTSSAILNLHNIVGVVLVVMGISIFCICAWQVYYRKLIKKGMVSGGLYKFIRHPQYSALILFGFGLLLLWPRYIVLLSFFTMLFAYYFLAKFEERECLERFGESYNAYRNTTGMFLPSFFSSANTRRILPRSGLKRYIAIILIYLLTEAAAIGWASVIARYSVDNLYSFYSQNAVFISVTKIDENALSQISTIALTNADIIRRLKLDSIATETRYINYIIPDDLYISEIPMKKVNEIDCNHFLQRNSPGNTFKIIFTKAVMNDSNIVHGKNILLKSVKRVPLLEVRIDISQNKILEISNPSTEMNYGNIPMPVF